MVFILHRFKIKLIKSADTHTHRHRTNLFSLFPARRRNNPQIDISIKITFISARALFEIFHKPFFFRLCFMRANLFVTQCARDRINKCWASRIECTEGAVAAAVYGDFWLVAISLSLSLWINNGSLGELCSKCISYTHSSWFDCRYMCMCVWERMGHQVRMCINRIVVKTI